MKENLEDAVSKEIRDSKSQDNSHKVITEGDNMKWPQTKTAIKLSRTII